MASKGAVKDLTGMVFNRLTVVQQDGWIVHPSGGRTAKWLCKCSCGKTTSVKSAYLTNGQTKSCGCLQTEASKRNGKRLGLRYGGNRKLPEGESAFNRLYDSYKRNAKIRGYPFCITKDAFKSLTKGPCHYCGDIPIREYGAGWKTNGSYVYNGVDRIDNMKGYEEGNVVSCCAVCNHAKHTMSNEEFFDMVKKIYEKHLHSE